MEPIIRKLIRWLFILILLAGIVWTGIRGYVRIDKGYRAILWDKIRGTRNKIFLPGPHFFPIRAIPPYFKMSLFPDTEKPITGKILINLPYMDSLVHAGDFKIEFRVTLYYKINNEHLFYLSKGENYADFKDEIKQTLLENEKGYFINKILQIILTEKKEFTKKLMFSELYEYSTSLLKERYGSNIKITALRHTLISLPDIQKYREHYAIADKFAKEKSTEYVKKMIELNYKKRKSKTLTDIEIKRLKNYIALMKKGHDILPFLFMEKLSDKIRVVVIPEGSKGIDFRKYFNFFKNKKQTK